MTGTGDSLLRTSSSVLRTLNVKWDQKAQRPTFSADTGVAVHIVLA